MKDLLFKKGTLFLIVLIISMILTSCMSTNNTEMNKIEHGGYIASFINSKDKSKKIGKDFIIDKLSQINDIDVNNPGVKSQWAVSYTNA